MTGDIVFNIINRSAITSLIGSNPVRLFPNILRQGESKDSLVYRTVINAANPTFDGSSTLDHFFVDFYAYCRDKSGCDALITTLRSQLDRTSGTFGGVVVTNISYVDSGSDDFHEDILFYTKQIEFKITYRR
jgi:hypothetical protein